MIERLTFPLLLPARHLLAPAHQCDGLIESAQAPQHVHPTPGAERGNLIGSARHANRDRLEHGPVFFVHDFEQVIHEPRAQLLETNVELGFEFAFDRRRHQRFDLAVRRPVFVKLLATLRLAESLILANAIVRFAAVIALRTDRIIAARLGRGGRRRLVLGIA